MGWRKKKKWRRVHQVVRLSLSIGQVLSEENEVNKQKRNPINYVRRYATMSLLTGESRRRVCRATRSIFMDSHNNDILMNRRSRLPWRQTNKRARESSERSYLWSENEKSQVKQHSTHKMKLACSALWITSFTQARIRHVRWAVAGSIAAELSSRELIKWDKRVG